LTGRLPACPASAKDCLLANDHAATRAAFDNVTNNRLGTHTLVSMGTTAGTSIDRTCSGCPTVYTASGSAAGLSRMPGLRQPSKNLMAFLAGPPGPRQASKHLFTPSVRSPLAGS